MKARSSQYLVAERLGGDDGDLLNDPLVGVEVESQLRVVLLDDDTSSLLHGLGSDTAHLGLLWKNKAQLFNLFALNYSMLVFVNYIYTIDWRSKHSSCSVPHV